MIDFPQQNTGILLGQRRADWIGGSIPYEVRNASGDWRSFLPIGEKQRPNVTDVMACVTFSALNNLEVQYLMQMGMEINFSDRYTAKDSGTTQNGNYLYKVADSIRTGVVLESDYPAPTGNFNWNTYYQDIPADVRTKVKTYAINNEFIDKKDLDYHLKQSPIQIIVTDTDPRHAVLAVAKEGNKVWYFDSYQPFLKNTVISNIYSSCMKYVANFSQLPVITENMFLANDKGTVYLVTGNQDKRKIGIADLKSLGLFGDEPQVQMDTSKIPEYNTIVEASKITHK